MSATLNTNDLLEAGIVHGYQRRSYGRPTHARRGVRKTGAKVVANARLEFVPECSEFFAIDLAETRSDFKFDAQLPCQCSACTFSNAGAMPTCEICGTPQQQYSNCSPAMASVERRSLLKHDVASWPSLAEAANESFAFCEVSSAGSSWLEVGERDEHLSDDDTCSVTSFWLFDDASALSEVKSSPSPANTVVSWASRLAQNPGLVSPRRPPVRMPPLTRHVHQQLSEADVAESIESCPSNVDEMADGDLDELQERRPHATVRGKP